MLKLKFFLASALVALALAFALPLWPGGADAAPGNQTLCPVMGFDIARDLFTDYQGKRVYFCCPSCPPEFKKTPDAFMEQMRDQGVTPEDAPA